MFNKLKERIKAKIESRKKEKKQFLLEEERLNTTYPNSQVYRGSYEKNVQEGNINYTYTHSEYFLLNNDNAEATTCIRLTGENLDNSNVSIISKKSSELGGDDFVLEDNGITYKLWTGRSNSFWSGTNEEEQITLKDLIEAINYANAINSYKIKRTLELQENNNDFEQ